MFISMYSILLLLGNEIYGLRIRLESLIGFFSILAGAPGTGEDEPVAVTDMASN